MEFPGSIVLSIWLIFMLLFLLLKFNSVSSSSFVRKKHEDRITLLSIKSEINDTQGILSSWNQSIHFCEWRGITCGRKHQRVRALDLQSSGLKGRLSPHIGNLSFLRVLSLSNNSFSHTIPQEIGRLLQLQKLYLDNNSFSGHIPTNMTRCSNLQAIDLYGNTLSGKLPNEIGSLSKLEKLTLGKNHLIGIIPPSFGNLSSIVWLHVEENGLYGSIPNSLGKLKNLTLLVLGQNSLTGTVPPSIYNLSLIQVISLPSCQLHGVLPSGLGHTIFPNLQGFYFQSNRFSGPLPNSISNASNLRIFQIYENKFTGKVPSLTRMSSLNWLGLHDNNLGDNEEGDLDFLSSLFNCTNLRVLTINDNNFGGVLPKSVSNLSIKLTEMHSGGNLIRGNIPTGIGNLINLEVISFEENQFTGTIPSSIGKLRQLHSLYLNSNELSGTIPSSFGNMSLIGELVLSSNNLQGSIPQSLGQCSRLQLLLLYENNLSGGIPKQIIGLSSLSRDLDLGSNQLTGSIPREVGNLVHLFLLNVSDNKLTGEIPRSLGSCTSLVNLYLSANLLKGEIPESLSSLKGIEDFDLSNNNLSGKIPIYLASFHFLQSLDLSFNDLEGEVPMEGVFKNTSAFSIMGNTRLCGGIPQLRLPICISKKSKKEISSRMKLIMSIICGAIGLILVFLFVFLFRSRKQRVLKSAPGSNLGVSPLRLSYGDLLKATDGFSSLNLIGAGSFGSVYKGVVNVQEEKVVAVKVLNLQISRASKSFIAECEALRNVRHRNLVKLLSACSSIDFQGNEFKALVYEFMTNGSVDDWLHNSAKRNVNGPSGTRHLDLVQRVNIAIDVASAVDYLHNNCDMPIVHCDLKPSNVLLDGDMTAHVGDFGLARCLPDAFRPLPSRESSSNPIKGSIGYAAPEYGMGNKVSTYGDVYSYGMLLLEMITGKMPTDEMFKDELNLHNFVLMALPERVEEICDPMLLQIMHSSAITNPSKHYRNQFQNEVRQRVYKECLISLARIGVACSAEFPGERMEISNVVAELCVIRDELTRTRRPS